MQSFSLLPLLLLLAAVATCTAAPDFCNGLDCPTYKVLMSHNQTSNVEVRHYPAATWVSTVIQGVMDYEDAINEGFHRLFDYISGDNTARAPVPMTAPVVVRVRAGAGPFCASNFTVSFFVPFALQASPPTPSSRLVYVDHVPDYRVGVTWFSGFANKWSVNVPYFEQLANSLDEMHLRYNQEEPITAGYDSPFQLFNRHNEVWLEIIG
mmetsp:Transcript_19280/g.48999  ORF Transcript_19280/g.48999 Transcript_19280/m.48999 type:complete len:209 (-) Transcript_19280:105-731(-)|eukprot:CAMPEP_0177656744 /NCGR_PEP_ID=MMETSP0447-20121125/15759_1 /TAXON_ID=0 /ORGANISM="Stygamoeba regulata, Strain BSH-02190019" /LENGTH=208 /DNA_ID=CAMNT_0019160941 /DNA_START=84 /DNA_END=710 /DNA_ORIENTATION=+